jgi:hypothetical protein
MSFIFPQLVGTGQLCSEIDRTCLHGSDNCQKGGASMKGMYCRGHIVLEDGAMP